MPQFRLTNTANAARVRHDANGKAFTIEPGQFRENVELTEDAARRLRALGGPVKIERMGASPRLEVGSSGPRSAAKSFSSGDHKPAQEPAKQDDGEAAATNADAKTGDDANKGGEKQGDEKDADAKPSALPEGTTAAQLADMGEKNELSHWVFVKAAKEFLGTENFPTKKADIIEALRAV